MLRLSKTWTLGSRWTPRCKAACPKETPVLIEDQMEASLDSKFQTLPAKMQTKVGYLRTKSTAQNGKMLRTRETVSSKMIAEKYRLCMTSSWALQEQGA